MLSCQEVEVPPSLRYMFVNPLESYAEFRRSNYLIAGLLYRHSILVENFQAETFPYCQDLSVLSRLQQTSYFIEGDEFTNLRRIEDLVVIDFRPDLIITPEGNRYYNNYISLRKQFNYLKQQVQEFRRSYFSRAWIERYYSINFQELFQFDPHQSHTDIFEKIIHQIELETQRYLTLNKYHLIHLAHLETGVPYQFIHRSVRAKDPNIDQRFLNIHWRTSQQETLFCRYIFDYCQDPQERATEAPAWTLAQVSDNVQDRYPFVPIQEARSANWILTTSPIATRFKFSDFTGDQDAIRYGQAQSSWNNGSSGGWRVRLQRTGRW